MMHLHNWLGNTPRAQIGKHDAYTTEWLHAYQFAHFGLDFGCLQQVPGVEDSSFSVDFLCKEIKELTR